MKTVFITGATKNTGLAIAKYFAMKGYQVAISSRSIETAEKTAAELSKVYGIKAKTKELSTIRTPFPNFKGFSISQYNP